MTDPENSDFLHMAIHAKLAQLATASPVPPPWAAPLVSLGPESSEEDRLAVYQAVRAAGSVPAEASLYLVAWQIDAIALEVADEALRKQEDRLEAIKRQHGLAEGDCWPPGEGSPEYEEAQEALHDAWDALFAAKLAEYGEHEMASLFRTDPERFEQMQEVGRQFFHGATEDDDTEDDDTEDDDWLDSLLQAVTDCIQADSPMGPLGLHYREEDDFWEIRIFPTPVELVGGAQDGAVVDPGFSLDLEQLRASFDSVDDLGWNALGLNDPDGPHIHVEGKFMGRDVFLQLLAYAPEDEEAGLKIDVSRCGPKPE